MKGNAEHFWETQHRREHKSHLSGCQYQETIDFLQIQEYIRPGMNVLEVGVGLGYVTKGLHANKCHVYALDISPTALKKVQKYCIKTFCISQLEELPRDFFDLVICHNVVQHIATPELRHELNLIIQSLTLRGLFAMEFVSIGNVPDTWNANYTYKPYLPTFGRSISFMMDMVNKSGGNASVEVSNPCSAKKVTGCHVFHINRLGGQFE